MAGPTSKSAWTSMERKHAAKWSEVFGEETHRVPLSGVSSRHNAGDLIIPKDGSKLKYDMLVEHKFRATNAQHKLFLAAQDDAARNKVDPEHVLLTTRVKGSRTGDLITLHENLFYELMKLPGALELLK